VCFGLLLGLANAAAAGEIKGLRPFVVPGGARIVVLADGPPADLQLRQLPRGEDGQARAAVLLGDSTLSAAARPRVVVEKNGLRAVGFRPMATAVQVLVETDRPARLSARDLLQNGRYVATIIDVELSGGVVAPAGAPAAAGQPLDPWSSAVEEVDAAALRSQPGLPGDEELLSWLKGASLSRSPALATRRPGVPLVVIDAGHGGHDHGAVGPSGAREADIALQIARRAAQLLREEHDVDVILTRDADEFLGLRARAAVANAREADLFLSVHINAAPGPEARGVETYVLDNATDEGAARVAARENRELGALGEDLTQNDALMASLVVAGTDRLSLGLAADLQRRAVARHARTYGPGELRDLGVKGAAFTVLASARCPAVLFEAGFISNPDEERLLRSPHFQQQTAVALAEGVAAWLKGPAARAKSGEDPTLLMGVPSRVGVIRAPLALPEPPPVLGLPTTAPPVDAGAGE
jgi:N-acetylmuramoyl-L-alanine amidase